ncbi:MAG TPA: aminoacyl-tRNA hydrolase [Candidatus Bathyarchaeia archaeon]|nr:aminoacyl-tRNA hydrolase [Candidatus Bathyarchaeia archaeon]
MKGEQQKILHKGSNANAKINAFITLVHNKAKLQALSRDAFAQGINPAKIYDAGKTQLKPSTFTALGIRPAPEYKIDPMIKDLKLL